MNQATTPDSTAENATPKADNRPGSNPNKDNAKPRKGNRPRTKNSPSAKTNTETKWIDPLPHVNPISADLTPIIESLPSGEFDLDFDLPTRIATPFSEAFANVAPRTIGNNEVVAHTSAKILSLGFYKAAKQLYSTMTDPEKGINQPLKIVYYDGTEVPSHMAAALSMIGHLDTKFGKIYLRNASTLFKRWIVHGLYIDPDGGYEPAMLMDLPANTLVWRDHDGLALVHRLALEYVEDLRLNTYDINIAGTPLRYSIPTLTGVNDLNDYYGHILPDQPFTEELRDLVSLLGITSQAWLRGELILPHGRDVGQCFARLNLNIAPDSHSQSELRLKFEHVMSSYIVRDSMHVGGLFNLAASPSGNFGYSAQLVNSDGLRAHTTLPISDSDMAYGYTFNPCGHFKFSPKIVAYSQFSQEQSASAIAHKDFKSIAI